MRRSQIDSRSPETLTRFPSGYAVHPAASQHAVLPLQYAMKAGPLEKLIGRRP